jgi:hypothetical protein
LAPAVHNPVGDKSAQGSHNQQDASKEPDPFLALFFLVVHGCSLFLITRH